MTKTMEDTSIVMAIAKFRRFGDRTGTENQRDPRGTR